MAALPSTRSEELIAQLRLICGPSYVFTDAATLQTYSADALTRYRQVPLAVVLPANVAECQAVLRACHAAEIPFVPRGAGTGLAGGALPLENAIVIGLARMRSILALDLDAGLITVQAGITAGAVNRAVAPSHFYPVTPSSGEASTIGGNIATNAGGPNAARYGLTGDFVHGIDVLLSDGTELHLRRDDPGFDLVGGFIGAEGTFGIVVKATLRVLPRPSQMLLFRADFRSLAAAANAGARTLAAGVEPAAAEATERETLTRAMAGRRSPWLIAGDPTEGPGGVLLAELDGSPEQCDRDAQRFVEVCRRSGAITMRSTEDPPPGARVSRLRALLLPLSFDAPASQFVDLAVPASALSTLIGQIEELTLAAGLRVISTVRPFDGVLTAKLLFDPAIAGAAQSAATLVEQFAAASVALGGAIGGAHGIGVDKLAALGQSRGADDLRLQRQLHRAFDPTSLANRSKLYPRPETD